MNQLDDWTEKNVVEPLYYALTSEDMDEGAVTRVKKAIREKVLESYHNGINTPKTIKPHNNAPRFHR
jgi:hypothetical protein